MTGWWQKKLTDLRESSAMKDTAEKCEDLEPMKRRANSPAVAITPQFGKQNIATQKTEVKHDEAEDDKDNFANSKAMFRLLAHRWAKRLAELARAELTESGATKLSDVKIGELALSKHLTISLAMAVTSQVGKNKAKRDETEDEKRCFTIMKDSCKPMTGLWKKRFKHLTECRAMQRLRREDG